MVHTPTTNDILQCSYKLSTNSDCATDATAAAHHPVGFAVGCLVGCFIGLLSTAVGDFWDPLHHEINTAGTGAARK
jgi:hypothetical protein